MYSIRSPWYSNHMKWRRTHAALLGILLVVSAIMRFTNLNWDGGHQVHPDEALIVKGAMTIRFFSNMNPGFHDYNGLPMNLLRATSLVVSGLTRNQAYLETPQGMTLVGRAISAAASTLSVAFLYILAIQVFAPVFALIGATVFAFSPLLIQLAHFSTTDTLLVLFLILLTLALVAKRMTWAALALAAACATKNTGYIFSVLPALFILFSRNSWPKKIRDGMMLVSTSLVGFFFLSPHTFMDLSGYLDRSRYLSDIASGKLVFDWSVQFLGTTPMFFLTQTIVALGPLAIVGPIGLLLLLRKSAPLRAIALWTLGLAIALSMAFLKFIRYSAPLAVGYALGYAYLFVLFKRSRLIQGALLFFAVVQMLWGILFFSLYLSPHTTFQAAAWMATHIPDNVTILYEDWNSIIRYDLPPLSGKNIHLTSFNFYSFPDDEEKIKKLTNILPTVDYIIFDSPKVRNTIVRLKDRYSLTARFYLSLESGKLGFTRIGTFSSYPKLGSLEIPDDTVEETFYVFDHPTVTIYKKNSTTQ